MSSASIEGKWDEMRSGRAIAEQDMQIETQSRLRKPIHIKSPNVQIGLKSERRYSNIRESRAEDYRMKSEQKLEDKKPNAHWDTTRKDRRETQTEARNKKGLIFEGF